MAECPVPKTLLVCQGGYQNLEFIKSHKWMDPGRGGSLQKWLTMLEHGNFKPALCVDFPMKFNHHSTQF